MVKLTTTLAITIIDLNKQIEQEKPKRSGSALKHFLHQLTTDYLPRKQKYEFDNATFGDRNSFSKTDLERMKENPMLNG